MIKQYIYVGNTENKGRGVFTKKAIKSGIIVERSPVIVMSENDRMLLDQTLLYNYIFEWQPDEQELCCMALGFVPLYNHSYASNCEYCMDYEKGEIYIEAVREIEPGEELTINYNGTWDDATPLWFDAK